MSEVLSGLLRGVVLVVLPEFLLPADVFLLLSLPERLLLLPVPERLPEFDFGFAILLLLFKLFEILIVNAI